MTKETTIIKLYDNEDYNYPLIEIEKGYLTLFKAVLEHYKTKPEYNLDDFLDLIKKKKWFICTISHDEEIYF